MYNWSKACGCYLATTDVTCRYLPSRADFSRTQHIYQVEATAYPEDFKMGFLIELVKLLAKVRQGKHYQVDSGTSQQALSDFESLLIIIKLLNLFTN